MTLFQRDRIRRGYNWIRSMKIRTIGKLLTKEGTSHHARRLTIIDMHHDHCSARSSSSCHGIQRFGEGTQEFTITTVPAAGNPKDNISKWTTQIKHQNDVYA